VGGVRPAGALDAHLGEERPDIVRNSLALWEVDSVTAVGQPAGPNLDHRLVDT